MIKTDHTKDTRRAEGTNIALLRTTTTTGERWLQLPLEEPHLEGLLCMLQGKPALIVTMGVASRTGLLRLIVEWEVMRR